MTVAMMLKTDFSVSAITSKVNGFWGPYPASASRAFALVGS